MWQLPRRLAVALIVAAAVLVRVGAIAGEPITSDDLYRYSWDGRVQAAGIDPYRYPPSAPQLAGLREDWLWPAPDRCVAVGRPTGCTLINRSTVPTIYPPAAEAWFATVYRVAGIESRHKAWQVAGLAVDVAAVGLLVVALRRWRRDLRWTALYALCPAPALELANNGHVDGVAVALMLAALVVARPPPRPSPLLRSSAVRDVVVGFLIGAAVLVKLYPALLLIALVAAPGADRWRRAARASVAAAVLVAVAYLPHVLAVGGRVLGYLPGTWPRRTTERRSVPPGCCDGARRGARRNRLARGVRRCRQRRRGAPPGRADRRGRGVRNLAARHVTSAAVVLDHGARPGRVGRTAVVGGRDARRVPVLLRRHPRLTACRRDRTGRIWARRHRDRRQRAGLGARHARSWRRRSWPRPHGSRTSLETCAEPRGGQHNCRLGRWCRHLDDRRGRRGGAMTVIDPAMTSPTGCADAAAIIDFVSAHRESMVRVACGYVHDRATAEDVVQETWIAALRGADRFGGRSSMKTWIFTILVNRAKTTGTRQARVVPMSSLPELQRGEDGTCEQTIEDRVALAADAGAALDAIALLPHPPARRDHAARRPVVEATRGVRADGHHRGQPASAAPPRSAWRAPSPAAASSPSSWRADYVRRLRMRTATLTAATSHTAASRRSTVRP